MAIRKNDWLLCLKLRLGFSTFAFNLVVVLSTLASISFILIADWIVRTHFLGKHWFQFRFGSTSTYRHVAALLSNHIRFNNDAECFGTEMRWVPLAALPFSNRATQFSYIDFKSCLPGTVSMFRRLMTWRPWCVARNTQRNFRRPHNKNSCAFRIRKCRRASRRQPMRWHQIRNSLYRFPIGIVSTTHMEHTTHMHRIVLGISFDFFFIL